jgi:BASS family bile acid:Na+ symporter
MASICVIIAITVALAAPDLRRVGLPLFAAAVCHNATGFLLGYSAARAARLDARDSRTVSIEVGIQNGGMATALALNALHSPAAALAAAVFGPWSAFAAAMLAVIWSRRQSAAGRRAAWPRHCRRSR